MSRTLFGLPGTQVVDLCRAATPPRRSSGGRHARACRLLHGDRRGTVDRAFRGVADDPRPGVHLCALGRRGSPARFGAIALRRARARTADGRSAALQAIDQATIAGPLVKVVIRAVSADDFGSAAVEALALCEAGEPGPVLRGCRRRSAAQARLDLPAASAPLPVADAYDAAVAARLEGGSTAAATRRQALGAGRGGAAARSSASTRPCSRRPRAGVSCPRIIHDACRSTRPGRPPPM